MRHFCGMLKKEHIEGCITIIYKITNEINNEMVIAYADERYADFVINKNSARAQPIEVFDTVTH